MSYSGKTTSGQLGTGGDNEVAADSGTAANLQGGKSLTVSGGEGIDTSIANSSGNLTVTVAAEEATDSNKGVASFASADFSVSSGAVSLVDLTVSHVAAATLVTESEGISSNDNDTTLPTSAAVKDYVDTKVTAEDLDITTDSGTIDIDLDGDTLTITGGEGIDTSATGTTVTIAAEEGTDANKGVVIVAGGTGATVGYSSGTATVNVDAAQTQITSVGTIGTGVWNGTVVASAYLDADTAHLTGTQTFSGAKSFTGGVTIDEGELTLGSTAVSSTAAELNVLDGLNRGHIIVGNASNAPTSLAEGSEDQVLTIDSNGDAVWADASGGGGASTGWHVESDASSSNGSAFSPASDTVVVMCVTASGARYVQLPAVSGNTDRIFVIKDKSNSAGTNNITVLSNSSEEIEGSTADYVISTSGASVTFITDGSKWYII